jgi:hypothetical protein
MPNWCINKAEFRHQDAEVIQKLCDLIEAGGKEGEVSLGLFSVFFPRPLEKEEDWHDWNVLNWGTKWDVPLNQVECSRTDATVLTLNFHTAWAPPVEFYRHIAENNGFYVEAAYLEPGMAFCGRYCSEADVDTHYDLPETVEETEDLKYIMDTGGVMRELIEWWASHLREQEGEEEDEGGTAAANVEGEPNGEGEKVLSEAESGDEATENKEEVAQEPITRKEEKNVENE